MPRTAKKQAAEPVHIVARWTSSQIIYGWDSRERTGNPDYHAPISLTSKGTFQDDAGRPIDPKDVPEHIRAEAKRASLDIVYHPPVRRDLSLKDAMAGAERAERKHDPLFA